MTDAPASERASVGERVVWRTAVVVASVKESPTARTLVFDIDGWDGHRAGQHIDVRLTAPDGYQATRSFSLSSGPGEAPQITVERVDDGEISPFLVDEIELCESIEVRGPIGGYFVWQPSDVPVVLIGGGSGLAPLRAIWRAAADGLQQVVVGASARTADRLLYADELEALGARVHLTQEMDTGCWSGRIGRTDIADLLADAASQIPLADAVVFVCGPTGFVEHIAALLRAEGVQPDAMRLERFG